MRSALISFSRNAKFLWDTAQKEKVVAYLEMMGQSLEAEYSQKETKVEAIKDALFFAFFLFV